MKILVTGGAGFIGSNLCRRLISDGHEVLCVDNFVSGKKENIENLFAYPQFDFMEGDICHFDILKNIIKVDQIYHLACPASPVFYQRDPLYTMKTCFEGMLNVLELARIKGARVLQASTSEVYGNPLVFVQSENYFGNVNPNGARSCYDEGKRIAETICCDYRKIYKTDVKIVRIFNTYGPYMRLDDGRVISNFVNNALRDKDIVIYGDGQQTRSMCFISDMLDGLIGMMNSELMGPVNLGNPQEITILALAEKIKSMLASNVDIVNADALEDDPRKRKPDITLAQEMLHWTPKVSLEEGLRCTIQYYRRLMQDSQEAST